MAETQQLDLSSEGLTTKETKVSVDKWVDFAMETGQPLSIVGPGGYGKTASVTARIKKKKVDGVPVKAICISLAQADWDTFFAPSPDGEGEDLKVQVLLHADLLSEEPKVIVFDESRRADKRSRQVLLEVMSEGTIAGIKIPNLLTVITLDNPGGSAEYLGVAGLDPAQGDRAFHLRVGIYDTPWKKWFEQSWPDIDFKAMWRWHASLDRVQRETMNPRNLEHMLKLGRAGFPVALGLGVLPSGRVKVLDATGNDTTDAVLGGFCQALGVAHLPVETVNVTDLIAWSIREGENLRIIGPHGRAKTKYVKSTVATMSDDFQEVHGVPLELEGFSAPLLSPSDLAILARGGNGELRHIIADRFTRAGRKIAVLVDERSRADRRISAALMALEQERAIAGQHLPTVQTVIALDNPTEYRGLRYEVGRMDVAQVSRYTSTVVIGDTDLPWRDYLVDTYGPSAGPIVDWWFEDLDETGKAVVTPRTLERIILAHQASMPLKAALGVIGHDQVDVPLVDLERRLAAEEVIGFGKLVEHVEDYVQRIAAGDEELAVTAKNALASADPERLKEHRTVCEAFVKVLPKDLAAALVRTKEPERQSFWASVLLVRLSK